ncbi:MAG: transglutaminase-like domain-containing protein, partial [Gemmataceae bacterium]
LSREQKLSLAGSVQGNKLVITGDGHAAGAAQEIQWPEGVLSIYREATLYKDKKPKPGDTFDYSYYEGRLNRVVKVTVNAKAIENVVLVAGQPPRKFLRLEAQMEPIGNFKIPPSTVWCDSETFEPLRTDSDMPSLGGRMIVLRTSKEVALRPVGKVPDLFDVQSIRLDQEIRGVHQKGTIIYRFRTESDAEFGTALPQDLRQSVKNIAVDGKGAELHVTPLRRPGPIPGNDVATEEFLGNSFFIDWNTDLVKQHSKSAVGTLPGNASAWDKATAIESWVNKNMKSVEFSQAMATTSQVAKTLSGDCTEYAMLSVGMCRAAGVPARTALGLVYASGRDGKPFLAYHMWFEVNVNNQWVALDATLGLGSVGPGHIKITDHNWHNEKSFAPLLPVLRVLMAQPKVEVLSVAESR